MTPLISVVLCTYNGEAFLREQLESICSQEYSNIEIVVVDDASQDSSWTILSEFALRDDRFRIHRNPQNQGILKSYESVLRHARGDLIAICDQDDVWRSNKLTVLASNIGDKALVYSDSTLIDETGQSMGLRSSDLFTMVREVQPETFSFMNWISGHNMLLRKTIVDSALPFPTGLYPDYWLAFVASQRGGIVYVDQVLTHYRKHGGGVTSVARKSAFQRHADQLALLTAYSAFEGPRRAFFQELKQLWLKREFQWFSWQLFCIVARNAQSLFAAKKRNPGSIRHATKYLKGLKSQSISESFRATFISYKKKTSGGR